MNTILECRGLTKRYGSGPAAVDNVNLSVPCGRKVGLVGPAGSGKSTLLKLFAGVITPDAGKIYIGGYEPGPQTKAIVSYLPSNIYIPARMQLEDVIKHMADLFEDMDTEKASLMLGDMGIDPCTEAGALNDCGRKKAAFAIALGRRVPLYLLDDPFENTDPSFAAYAAKAVCDLAADSSVIIAGNEQILAMCLIDDVIRMDRARAVSAGPAQREV